MNQKTLRQLLAQDKPLVLPCAHDALSARLIAQAGFEAYSIGGFGLVASRLGIPDLGLAGFGEISAGVRDIIAANKSPVIVDGDDGYGDAKNVTRTVRTYEAMGVHGLIIEDQTNPKRCGHMGARQSYRETLPSVSAGRPRRPSVRRILYHRPYRCFERFLEWMKRSHEASDSWRSARMPYLSKHPSRSKNSKPLAATSPRRWSSMPRRRDALPFYRRRNMHE